VDFLHNAPDALLRRPVARIGFAGFRRIHPSERVSKEVELLFRHLADPCPLLVDRELQPAHDLPQATQGFFGPAPSAQDHEIISIDHKPCANASLQPKLLSSQHEPAHIEIRQQGRDR
jgi:hypothetical protein